MASNSQLISELSGFIGSSSVPFYITPWTKDDVEAVLKKRDFTVCTDTTDVSISITSLQEARNAKKFTQLQFDRLYYITNGNARYFTDYLLVGNFSSLDTDILTQFRQITDLVASFFLQ